MDSRLFGTSEVKEIVTPFSKTDDESEFVAGLRNGDNHTLKKLFHTYFDRLFTFVFHEVGNDQAVAEDIVQETFIGALKSAKKFNGKSQIYTWLISIARHKIADYYRQVKREGKSSPRDNQSLNLVELIEDGASIVNLVESAEDKLIVEQALLSLPADYRQILVLKYVEEMPVTEISQVMKRSPKSIEGLLARGRKALRDKLDGAREG